ncbi:MAG TPA: bifunctional precorrin-2 dehydrogenase/sirohydrochlorin ferrochelatase [Candidatus Binatia bacterium]|nr:bifunctional precorrin-2 dehydrogenase/sirohydrochlorin ferrochelatase [Candidatus Binatia bacterium]
MRTHPVFLCLEGRLCVAVGGDRLIEDKVDACRRAGADVAVIAEQLTPGLRALADAGAIRWQARGYLPGDLRGAVVAYSSSRDPATIATLREEAARERVLLNVIDVPDACSFLAPAVIARGDLQVAIGTGGASPSLAAHLRREIERIVGPEYAPLVAILGAVRRARGSDPERAAVLQSLLDSPLLDLLRRGDRPGVDRLLARIAGESCTLDRLGVEALG